MIHCRGSSIGQQTMEMKKCTFTWRNSGVERTFIQRKKAFVISRKICLVPNYYRKKGGIHFRSKSICKVLLVRIYEKKEDLMCISWNDSVRSVDSRTQKQLGKKSESYPDLSNYAWWWQTFDWQSWVLVWWILYQSSGRSVEHIIEAHGKFWRRPHVALRLLGLASKQRISILKDGIIVTTFVVAKGSIESTLFWIA